MTPETAHALELDPRLALAATLPAVQEPPRLRPGTIPRAALVRALMACRDTPVVIAAAPAGYGKTTLLAEWAQRDERPFSWIESGAGAAEAATALIEQAAGARRPRVIVLDDAHRLSRDGVGAVMRAAARLGDGSVLALATRGSAPSPAARLRAHRLVADLGAGELAMTRLEAAMLLDGAGLRLSGRQVDRVLERTRGWPAALYLAALSLSAQDDTDAAVGHFDGSDRLIADYLRSELLAGIPADLRGLLRRWSILERLTVPLCDAVAGAPGSAAAFERLERAGLPLEALGRGYAGYRLHPLLRATLRAELLTLEPELERTLHERAADWHSSQGDAAGAVGHAVACRDAARAGGRLWELAPGYAISGRQAQLQRWLVRFPARERSRHAPLALAAAVAHLAHGRRFDASRAVDAADRAPRGRDAGCAAAAALLRAAIASDGVAKMASDAARARELAPDGTWEAVAVLLSGIAHQLADDAEAARDDLEQAASRSAGGTDVVGALARAQLALLAADASDWAEAEREAREAARALPMDVPAPLRALVLSVTAVVAAHRGEIASARSDAREAAELLASPTVFSPWLSAETQVWLARAELRLSEGPAGRALLARAAHAQAQVPGAAALTRWVHAGWALADAFAASATGDGPALTIAELRVLRLLESWMSFREIGERLHVSPNTVKTHALAVYRKLDVSCRSDAVSRGRVAGLIGG